MPYKDPIKAKESASRRYELNKDKIKARAKKFYEDNKETIKAQHQAKSKKLNEDSKKWRANNKDKIKQYKIKTADKVKIQSKKDRKTSIVELREHYVVSQLQKQTGLNRASLKENKDLIESHRMQIKVKRLIKNIKNGNQDTKTR